MRDILPKAMHLRRVAMAKPQPQPQPADGLSIPETSSPLTAAEPILRRQEIVAIPSTYGNLNDSQPPGNIVGIVFGSVAAFFFVVYLIYLCLNARGGRNEIIADEEIVVRERRGSRSSRRAETIEVSRSSSSSSRSSRPPRRSPARETRTERIIVEERRAPPVARDDDIVEVIEEHDPPRRVRSSRTRPESGYRTVDPDRYGGGIRPVHEVVREKSSRRSSGRR